MEVIMPNLRELEAALPVAPLKLIVLDNILEMVIVQGEANSLDVNQIKEAQGQVMSILKTLDGKAVLEEDMIKIVNDVIKSYNQPKLPINEVQEAN